MQLNWCNRRLFLAWALVVLTTGLGWAKAADAGGAEGPILLIDDGKSKATLVLAADLSKDVRRAVDDLVSYARQGTRATIESAPQSQAGRLEVHVGLTDYVRSLKIDQAALGVDGFVIQFPAPDRIVLLGGSDSGTEFAVYEFLERFFAVRWLFPGELGTHVPLAHRISIPTVDVESRPVIISRTISTMQLCDAGEPVFLWLQRNRRHWTIQHHHALDKLFPPAKYLQSHPEFFLMANGQRVVPDADGQNWQPMVDAPGIVEEAVANINAYFDQYPFSNSYSLGINDNNNFGRPAERINSVGLGDYSDLYFDFTTKVIDGVLQKHPDKWFGCLAYVGITDPPQKVGVHPRLVPHICIDRQGWASESGAAQDMQRTLNWHKAAPVLGWYDYVYGDDHYRIPRFYPHLQSRYLKFGAENGVKAYYAELYASPAWIEGPKMYVLMKLLWNPSADVDALLKEWYELAVGNKAAAPLAKYFQLWEDYWMKRVPETDWFKQYVNRVYFDFDHTGYLDPLTPDDLKTSETLLREVQSLAETPQQKARAEFLLKGFHEYARDVEYHVRLKTNPPGEDVKQTVILSDSFVPPAGTELTSEDAKRVPLPWGGWQNEPGKAKLWWDHSTGADDSHSLGIDCANAGTSVVYYRDFPVDDPSSLYHFRAAVQCTGVNPDAYVGIEVRWSRKDGKYLPRKYTSNAFRSAGLYDNGKWTVLDVYARPPRDVGALSMSVRLAAIYSKQGTVRFDNVRLSTLAETGSAK